VSDVGYFAQKAHFYHKTENGEKVEKYLKMILEKDLKKLLGPTENEVLYGRAGYLSALAYVRTFRPNFGETQILELLEDIIFNGLCEGKIIENVPILNWTWHKKVWGIRFFIDTKMYENFMSPTHRVRLKI